MAYHLLGGALHGGDEGAHGVLPEPEPHHVPHGRRLHLPNRKVNSIAECR